jgi:dCTP deaminase
LQRQLTSLYKSEYVPFGKHLVIHPHQFILAETFEFIRLPPHLAAYVIGRSTWGRLGLIVATAAGIHPGFSGTLTLELRNLGETPLALYPGQPIAQLFFHTVTPAVENVRPGQYSGRTALLPRRISSERTVQKLTALKKQNGT